MGILYVYAVTLVFALIALIWALYEGHKLDHMTDS